ncbi:unnamed protein product [Pleuronectes platessa]|uniref:Uncharacterized protein n=1 Tax=Pleuronectes platessa TaxID=8262 RepID=A0A9N7V023_PLEPL|nr:unnamed protein product [Pleuronectes platessa]
MATAESSFLPEQAKDRANDERAPDSGRGQEEWRESVGEVLLDRRQRLLYQSRITDDEKDHGDEEQIAARTAVETKRKGTGQNESPENRITESPGVGCPVAI